MRTNLKVFRVKRNLKQEEMADAIGCSRPTYASVESGRRDGRLEFWKRLQKTFNISDEEMWQMLKDESSGSNEQAD